MFCFRKRTAQLVLRYMAFQFVIVFSCLFALQVGVAL